MTDPSRPLLVWVDAQIPPAATRWIDDPGLVQAIHVFDLGLATAEDPELFEKARTAGAVVFTKDHDFVQLQERRGAPPNILWLTCGNVSVPYRVEIVDLKDAAPSLRRCVLEEATRWRQ